MITRTLQATLIVLGLRSAAAFGQSGTTTAASAVLLTVVTPLKLTAADLAKLPHRSLRAKAHDGKEASFDGIELGEILKLAGVKFVEQLSRCLRAT